MAFGKDPNQIQNIAPHGGSMIQRGRTVDRRPPRTGGGGFYWKNVFVPPDHSSCIVRLVAGSYPQEVTYDEETIVTDTFPYYMYREHHNGKRGAICSAGALWARKEKALPCPSCTIFWEDVAERKAKKARGDNTKGPNRMGCRDLFAFNVWDYSVYFEMPEVDGKGQARMNQKTNQPFMHWVKGNPNDPQFQGRPWKQGDLRPWPMGRTYKDTLFTYAAKIGNSCASCCTRDSLRCVMKVCGACGQHVYDPNNTALTDEQREQVDNFPYQCPQCGQTAFLGEIIECSNCQQPKRASVFDVDLEVQRVGTKGQQTFLQIITWSDPRPIQVADPEVLKTIQPLDLAKKFAPTPPELQNKIYGFSASPAPAPSAPPIIGQQPQVQPPAFSAGPAMHPPMQQPAQPQMPDAAPQAQPQYAPQPIPVPQAPVTPYQYPPAGYNPQGQ